MSTSTATVVTPSAAATSTRTRRPVLLVIAGLIVVGAAVLVVGGRWITPDPMHQDILSGDLGVGAPGHLLGTDHLGRDILHMAIGGARSALLGPLVIALGSMTIGILLGTLAGYRRGWVDFGISRWTDLLLSLPAILLAIVVAGILGAGYWVTVALLLVLFSPSDVRLVRAGILEQAPRPYVESARMLGLSSARIMYRHLLPNIGTLVLANLLLDYAMAVVSMSSLSFIGIGVGPGNADWGRQLADGQSFLFTNPAGVLVPSVLIVAVACSVSLLGDAVGARAEGER